MAFKDKKQAYKYNNEFIANAYDRINFTVPKGKKALIQTEAKKQGMSTNEYIQNALEYYYHSTSGGSFGFRSPDGEHNV